MNLSALGWNQYFAAQITSTVFKPARLAAQRGDRFLIHDGGLERQAVVRGRLRESALFPPVSGDWVLASNAADGSAVIEEILKRKTEIARRRPGKGEQPQVLAANVDRVLIVTSLDQDFSVRRIERYLTLTWDSGTTPVVVLTKSDLAADPQGYVRLAENCAPGFPVIAMSATTGAGMDKLRDTLRAGETVVLLGSSGVGKSTLLNALAGTGLRETAEVRESDSKGRHTTTDRQLFLLPSGVMVIDTPGLREVQLWADETSLALSFSEIAELAVECQFRDCSHTVEPGCAVLSAVQEGSVDPARLESFLRQRRELEYQSRQSDPAEAAEHKRSLKQIMRAQKQHYKTSRKL